MTGNELHRCTSSLERIGRKQRRLFRMLLLPSREIHLEPSTSVRLNQLVTLLLFTYVAFQQFNLCYSIKANQQHQQQQQQHQQHQQPSTWLNHPQPNSASSQQKLPYGISETSRSHQDDNNHNDHRYRAAAAAAAIAPLETRTQVVTPGTRIVDRRDTESDELEPNSSQPSEDSEDPDSSSSGDGSSSSSDETTGGSDDGSSSSSTSGTTDDYNATSPSSTSSRDDTDAIDVDPPTPDITRSSGAQVNVPRRRSETMMDLARNPQRITTPPGMATTPTSGINRQRQMSNSVGGGGGMQQVSATVQPQPPTTMSSLMGRNSQRPPPATNHQAGGGVQAQSMATASNLMRDPHQQLQPEANMVHHRNQQQQQNHYHNQQPFVTTAPTRNQQQVEPMPVATFNLNMGADRMLIKPHHQLRVETITPPLSTRSSAMNQQEMATESVNHELLMSQPVPISDRRPLDSLYPSSSSSSSLSLSKAVMLDQQQQQQGTTGHHELAGGGNNNIAMRHSIESSSFVSRVPQSVALSNEQDQQEMAAQVSMPSICYTPLALIMVVVVTMMITILVCFCTHVLIRHLGRHRFDLIESSRQLNTKYGCGQVQSATGGRPPMLAPIESGGGGGVALPTSGDGGEPRDASNKSHSFMLNLFQNDQSLRPQNNDLAGEGKTQLQRLCDEHGFAFDNPYFRDENGLAGDRHAAYLRQQQQHQQQQQQQQQLEQQQRQQVHDQQVQHGLLTTQNDTAREQLHFIEHHISNLHNKQVTSSVKELSILGSPSAVVDLTSEEQRAKVLANPREGDLVSVDITGHDIIGLGFDVYGDQQGGIFVKSVQTRGPARESGCIEPGDRIKCLNISFENMTLQDACDILNCGSPYKMRLLLEKRVGQVVKLDGVSSKTRSPIAFDQAIMLRQNQTPTSMGHKPPIAMIYAQQERALAGAPGGGGRRFVEAGRQCARRLAGFISRGGRSRSNLAQVNALEPYRDQFNTGFRAPGEQQLFEPLHHLGSAAARRQQFTLAANVSHLNQINYRNESGALGQQEQVVANRSPTNSIGSIQKGADPTAYSTDEDDDDDDDVDIEEEAEENGEMALDSSLEQFNNKNVNHRLHGPPLSGAGQQLNQVGAGGKKEQLGLHLATNEPLMNRLGQPRKQVSSAASEVAATAAAATTAAPPGIGVRRQSAADVVGQLGDLATLKRQAKLNQQHLEQTQSQPEMAIVRNDDNNGDDDDHHHRRHRHKSDADNESLAARSDADCNSADFAKGRALDELMAGSVSTPTMNLLSTGNNKANGGRADWQRISSRSKNSGKFPKQKTQNSIKEETTSDSSFGADSTSKLVGEADSKEVVLNGTNEQQKSSNNKNNSVETPNSALMTTTTTTNSTADAGASSLSSKTSTGTHITCLEPRKNIKKPIDMPQKQAIKGQNNRRNV